MTNYRHLQFKTRKQSVIELGEDYFENKYLTAPDIIKLVQCKSPDTKEPVLYGVFDDDQHYLETLKLLMTSTLEPQRKEEVFFDNVIPGLKKKDNFLDIGIGTGDFTQKIGAYFNNITIVDSSSEVLSTLPDKIGDSAVSKIHGSILDKNLNIHDVKYDLILLSHVLYYIPKQEQNTLVERLSHLLSETGILAIVFNAEGTRSTLINHFGGVADDFSTLYNLIPAYKKSVLYRMNEFLLGGDLESMMKIAGICLNDSGLEVTKTELTNYIDKEFCSSGECQISMIQNILLLGEFNDY